MFAGIIPDDTIKYSAKTLYIDRIRIFINSMCIYTSIYKNVFKRQI